MTVKNTFAVQFDIMERTEDGLGVTVVGQHTYYNLDGKVKMSDWVRGVLPKCKPSVNTTDGIICRTKKSGNARGTICVGSLGYFVNDSNGISSNAQYVILTALPHSHGSGFNILPENFDRVAAGFAARRLVVDNAWNDTDEYMAPNTEHPKYADWQKNCYIFSMLDHQSYQTSIKGEVDGEAYDFVNNFYPFTKKETYAILGLDWKQNSKEETRFIRSSGKLDTLTPEGQKVLDDFKACLSASAKARPEYAKAHPELQVQRWDCGWRQLKGLFADACPNEFAQLKASFKALKDKMLPLVYELGFLYK